MEYMLNGGFLKSLINRKTQEELGRVLIDKINNYTIDSCFTSDCGYETAIKKQNSCWIIVEHYETFEDMKKGHKRYCESVKNNPSGYMDVNIGMYREF